MAACRAIPAAMASAERREDTWIQVGPSVPGRCKEQWRQSSSCSQARSLGAARPFCNFWRLRARSRRFLPGLPLSGCEVGGGAGFHIVNELRSAHQGRRALGARAVMVGQGAAAPNAGTVIENYS